MKLRKLEKSQNDAAESESDDDLSINLFLKKSKNVEIKANPLKSDERTSN